MTSITCYKCEIPFLLPLKEYNRQVRNGRNYFYCSRSCAQSYIKKTTNKIIANCLWCKNDFETTTHKKARKCCSVDCAVKYAQSKTDPLVHKQSVQRPKTFPRQKEFVCVICGSRFSRSILFVNQKFQVCNRKCHLELLRQKAIENPNCGGETGYRHYKYKGIWMDSKWEVELAKWMDAEGIRWGRDRKRHMFWWTDDNGDKRRYYPDFYLPKFDVYLDPKNKYKMKQDRIKMERVVEENGIILFWGLFENVKKEVDILQGV